MYVKKSINVDVEITEEDITRAIVKNWFKTNEVASIVTAGNAFLRENGVTKSNNTTMWDDDWGKLAISLKQKFPNPSEFENFLREIEILLD